MYTGYTVNDSPTRVFTAAESLTGGAFTAVALGENGAIPATASNVPVGIITAENDPTIPAGEDVTVQVRGGGYWIVAESIKAGDYLSVGAGGKAVKSTSGKFIYAQAMKPAAANAVAEVQIVNAGYKA